MAQTPEGALKVAAKKAGISFEEYKTLIASGKRHCTHCKQWKDTSAFGKDKTRYDGIDRSCFRCRRVANPYASLKGRVSTFKGHKHTIEAKTKMSEAAKNRKPGNHLGKKHSIETRIKISQATRERTPRGKDCHSYKDGRAEERKDQRFSMAYKRWRFDVFSRDRFICMECGDAKGGNLVAHHLKPFADYPELRFDVDNGITLCKDCHKKLHFPILPESIR